MSRKLLAFLRLTKPIVTASVYYTWLITYLIAAHTFDLFRFLLESLVIVLGISWGNALNNYFDRDIDAVMRRTRTKRVLAMNLLSVDEAKKFCISLGAVSIISMIAVSAYYRDFVTPVLYTVAMLTYVYLYTVLLKRRTWTSILIAAVAYMCVLLHAWYVATWSLSLAAFLIATMGYFWVLTHLWSIAMHWAEDYALADVPTLTVRFWRKPIIPFIAVALATTMTCLLALTPALLGLASPLYLPAVLAIFIAESVILTRIARRDWRFSKKLTFVCYKLTYPLLAVIFTALIVFHIL